MKKSLYEEFLAAAKEGEAAFAQHREKMKASGAFEFNELTQKVFELQSKLNLNLLRYLFSNGENEYLIDHLGSKFVEKKRNILDFLYSLDSEMRFFFLYQLKTNEALYAHT